MRKKKKKFKQLPELLAPAGSLPAALTAFDYGADAVYAGLEKFNARERTENFNFDDMSRLLAYSQKNNKKVYITLNTLVKESELPEIFEYISEIAKLSPDAVIIQDLGVLKILRDYFPEIEIHASTQMGFHNSAGVNFASKLGIKRVILERQNTLEEIETIVNKTKVEIEVFIHGALCCSMSGNCLLSSWLGGWSGNRGKCKQPCRRRYYSDSGNGFFLSTKDLYSLDIIPKLKQIGIKTLKIEGRLRKPDYVKNTVSAYRLLLDSDSEEDFDKILRKGREILSRSLGRKWSFGFRDKNAFKDVIEHKKLGVSGQPYGYVVKTADNGFTANLTKRLHIGDRIRVQPKSGDEGPTMTVTKLYQNRKNVNKVIQNSECFIPCDKDIPDNGLIYKIGESGGELTSKIRNLPLKSFPVDLNISVTENSFSIQINNVPFKKTWKKKVELEKAKNKSLSSEVISEMFKSTNSERYSLRNTEVSIDDDYFIPLSKLKQIRREFWNWFNENFSESSMHSHIYKALESFQKRYSEKQGPKSIKEEYSVQENITDRTKVSGGNTIKVHTLDDFNHATDEIILPNYCFEQNLPIIQRKIRKAVTKGKKRFRITSLYQFELLKSFNNIKVCTSYPLPISNSISADEVINIAKIMKLKLNHVQGWVELEKKELEKMIEKTQVPVEIYYYGRLPVFVSRAYMPVKGKIADGKGNIFFVVADSKSGLVYLYPEKVLSIPHIPNTSIFKDLSMAEKDEKNTSSFNFEHTLL